MAKSIVAQVAELEHLSMENLRRKWLTLHNAQPPVGSNRRQLIARLAYRLQELVFGGLSEQTKEWLASGTSTPSVTGKVNAPVQVVPGTHFLREWKGVRYEVTALNSGFEYRGKRYRSLSAIATEITGTKWNGPDFFGLRRKGVAEAQSAGRRTK